MDLARGSERQSVDDDWMNCTVAQQLFGEGCAGLAPRQTFAARSWAGCTTNMFGFDLRQAQAISGLAYASGISRPLYQLLARHKVFADALATKLEDKSGRERVIEWIGLAYLWGDEQLDSPILQTIFAAGIADVETLAELFWQIRRDELSEEQVDRVLAFWDRCLTWVKDRREPRDHFMARLSRLSPFIKRLDSRTRPLLSAVIPYVHTDYGTDQMVEELTRLIDTDAAGVAALLEEMLESSAPNFDLDDKLKKLIETLASLGLRAEAIRCTEKVRRSLPGMLDLYKKLVSPP